MAKKLFKNYIQSLFIKSADAVDARFAVRAGLGKKRKISLGNLPFLFVNSLLRSLI